MENFGMTAAGIGGFSLISVNGAFYLSFG